MAAACHQCVPCERNPGLWLGLVAGEAARGGWDKLTLGLPADVAALGEWAEQLVAESTGKHGTGILPVVDEDLGPPEVYGSDRLFVAVRELDELANLDDTGGADRRASVVASRCSSVPRCSAGSSPSRWPATSSA